METETTLPAGDLEDEEYEEWVPYSVHMHKAMAPIIKKFFVEYFGERMYNLEPDTYREIDEIIKHGFIFGDCIAEYFHLHRTIKDEDLWEEAYAKFNRKDAKFAWQRKPQWYDKVYVNDDDEEFLEDIPESELTEEQKKAKEVVKCADKIIDFHIGFSAFMKQGCDLIIPAMQKFIEDTASFDLSILSPEGYELVQNDLDGITDYIFDLLYMIPQEET